MHPVVNLKHWSHELHDQISDHVHSRHFWAGVALVLLIVAVLSTLFVLARYAPIRYPQGMPYIPY